MTYITDIKSKTVESEYDRFDIVQIQFATEDDYFHITASQREDVIYIYVSDNEDIYNGLIKQNEELFEAIENDEDYYEDESNEYIYEDAREHYWDMTTSWFNKYEDSKYKREIEYTIYILDKLVHNENVDEIKEYEFDKIQFKMPNYTPFKMPGKRKKK